MAVRLLSHVVEDVCLGKPPLLSLCLSSATVADALSAIKASPHNVISIWDCHCHNSNPNSNAQTLIHNNKGLCECVGKISMGDIICFLCEEQNLRSPTSALISPLSVFLSSQSSSLLVNHVDPSTSLLEAINMIIQGTQYLVVPIQSSRTTFSRRKQLNPLGPTFHNGREYCMLTQEDLIQFILSRIGSFNPTPNLSLENLGLIQAEVLTVDYHAPASLAVGAITQALTDQTSIALVDEGGVLVGEISPLTLSACDETVVAAIMALSAGDLMSYIHWGGPPSEDVVRVMKAKLRDSKLEGWVEMLGDDDDDDDESSYSTLSSSSSDHESILSSSPSSKLARCNRARSYSIRMVRKAEAIVCHPRSSLVAVMVQAIVHRVNYLWVMDEYDCTLVGIVTFRDMLGVFREHLKTMLEERGEPSTSLLMYVCL